MLDIKTIENLQMFFDGCNYTVDDIVRLTGLPEHLAADVHDAIRKLNEI